MVKKLALRTQQSMIHVHMKHNSTTTTYMVYKDR